MEVLDMSTIKDRENLIEEKLPRLSGFAPRRLRKLTEQPLPRTTVNIECNHKLRTSRAESTHGHKSLEYQLWLEAGKHDPLQPNLPDASYNSNVWRNFRSNYGYHLNTKGRDTTETIAAAYPLAIPKPSKIGQYTYGRFLRETPGLIKDDRFREIAIKRTTMDDSAMEMLKLRTNTRNPPIDKDGNILPPEHYKKHPHYFKPIEDVPTTEYLLEQLKAAPPTPYGYHENRKPYTPKKSPAWRFKLNSSNSHYQRVISEIQRKSVASRSSRVKTCSPVSTSHAPSEVA